MKIYYEISLEDNIQFLAYQVKNQINPSINDSIKRWNIACFILLTIIFPIVEYYAINEKIVLIVCLIIGLIVFGIMNYKSNLRNLWWKLYKRKARRDFEKMYYADGKMTKKAYFIVAGNEITIENEERKRIYKDKKIFISDDENYFYIFFKNYEGTLIPKRFVSEENRVWFENLR